MQKINEKEELKSQAGMAEISSSAIFEELESEMPKEEVTQEQKNNNPFQFKYEVTLKKVPKKLASVVGLVENKVGRVIEVLDDKTVLVDFWDTKPAKIPIKSRLLSLSRTREELERDLGIITVKEIAEPLKFDQGKPRLDLIRPEFILGLGEALAYGATKYSEEVGKVPNYLSGNGLNYSKVLGSLERHLTQWKMGIDVDEESGLHHLKLAAANIMFLLTYESSDKGIDDRVILNKG